MKPVERWSIWVATVLVTVTGIVYAGMKYLLAPVEPWAVINHPLQPLVLKLHIVSAPLLVFALGMVAVRHVWRHISEAERAGRRSGWTGVLAAGPMVVTGYLIQAVTHERWLFWLAMGHLAAGLAFAAGVALHRWAVRQFRPAAAARESTAARSRFNVRTMRPHARVEDVP